MAPLRSPRGLVATIETPSARATGYDVDVDDGLSIIVYRYDSSLADTRVRLVHSVMGLMWSRVERCGVNRATTLTGCGVLANGLLW
jgi:hypothetical protein